MPNCTDAYRNFIANLERLNLFVKFSKALDLNATEIEKMKTELYWQKKSDETVEIREAILASNPELEQDQAKLMKQIIEQQRQSENKFLEELVEQFHTSRDELLIIQLVAIADSYRTELSETLLRRKTDSLRKHKQEIIKLLSENPTISDWDILYDDIVRIGVNTLTRNTKYQGWIEKIKNEFSLHISLKHQDVAQLEEIIATRNLLAHNGRIVNKDYLDRSLAYYQCVGGCTLILGDERKISHAYCLDAINCFGIVIGAIESGAWALLK